MKETMGEALADLLDKTQVCIISGGQFGQFEGQVLAHLPERADLTKLHLMPTCGTRYLRFTPVQGWTEVYAHNLSENEKTSAINAVELWAQQLGLWEEHHWGPRIEDRGSQITFSALGQEAPVAAKKAWDPDGSKREALREHISAELGDLEVRAGGSTSIDITRRGIDKAYGMRELETQTGIDLQDMLFVGDRLVPGGNDYPVQELGVPVHAVSGPEDTLAFVTALVPTLDEYPVVSDTAVSGDLARHPARSRRVHIPAVSESTSDRCSCTPSRPPEQD
jgi:hypothetical protein